MPPSLLLEHTPAACSFPGENARSWEALGEARPGQSSLSAGALRYRAWAQSWSSTREESGVLGFPSSRALTPRMRLECNREQRNGLGPPTKEHMEGPCTDKGSHKGLGLRQETLGSLDLCLCRGFLELRRPWGFSPEARRESQGASRAAPGKSGLHARGEGVPGESQGWGSLSCCSPWDCKESDMI